jgi:hypothetical protein
MVVGAALVLISAALFGYSKFVEWRHAVDVQAVAPPTEVLAGRLPIPTPVKP